MGVDPLVADCLGKFSSLDLYLTFSQGKSLRQLDIG